MLVNYIFLDIDGVLSTFRFIDYQVKNHECAHEDADLNFDPICMKNLKLLMSYMNNPKICISSSWRNSNTGLKDIELNLELYNIIFDKLYETPDLSKSSRADEIHKFITDNYIDIRLSNIIILDDEDIIGHDLEKFHIKCDDYNGFNKECLKKAAELIDKNRRLIKSNIEKLAPPKPKAPEPKAIKESIFKLKWR